MLASRPAPHNVLIYSSGVQLCRFSDGNEALSSGLGFHGSPAPLVSEGSDANTARVHSPILCSGANRCGVPSCPYTGDIRVFCSAEVVHIGPSIYSLPPLCLRFGRKWRKER